MPDLLSYLAIAVFMVGGSCVVSAVANGRTWWKATVLGVFGLGLWAVGLLILRAMPVAVIVER